MGNIGDSVFAKPRPSDDDLFGEEEVRGATTVVKSLQHKTGQRGRPRSRWKPRRPLKGGGKNKCDGAHSLDTD